MKATVLFACVVIGAISGTPVAPARAQLMLLTSCDELDAQARSMENGFHPPQEARVKARRAHFHSGPAPRCKDRKTFVVRDDHLTAHYRIDGWIHATYSNRKGDGLSAWFQASDLELVGVHGDRRRHCTIVADDIVGGWSAKEEESHFEEMAFERGSGGLVFNSWLHHRPDVVNARWQLDGCRLTIIDDHTEQHFQIVSATARQLELRTIDDGADADVQVYERVQG